MSEEVSQADVEQREIPEAVVSAAYLAIYGEGMNPLEHPEGWEYATTIAQAVSDAALSTPQPVEAAHQSASGVEQRARAREVLANTEHLPTCELRLDLGARTYSCSCDRPIRAMLDFAAHQSSPDSKTLREALEKLRKAMDLIDPSRPLQYARTMDLMRKCADDALATAAKDTDHE